MRRVWAFLARDQSALFARHREMEIAHRRKGNSRKRARKRSTPGVDTLGVAW
jgi:hypothetical protein